MTWGNKSQKGEPEKTTKADEPKAGAAKPAAPKPKSEGEKLASELRDAAQNGSLTIEGLRGVIQRIAQRVEKLK